VVDVLVLEMLGEIRDVERLAVDPHLVDVEERHTREVDEVAHVFLREHERVVRIRRAAAKEHDGRAPGVADLVERTRATIDRSAVVPADDD
jgi:hypothetical protein